MSARLAGIGFPQQGRAPRCWRVKPVHTRFYYDMKTVTLVANRRNRLPPPAEPDGKRATIRDVAAHAGVSIGTASKALNGQGKLRAETRDRVAAAARELGFSPNVLARGLLAGRTYTVGLITTDSFGRFSIPVMLGAEDALGRGPDLGVHVRHPGRPGPGAAAPGDAAQPPGGRPDRHRAADRAAAEHRLRPGHAGRLRDDPVPGQRRARDPAGRLRRRPPRRRAAAGGRADPHRAHHRPRAVPVRAQAGQRVLRRDRRVRGRVKFSSHDVLYGEWSEAWGRDAASILLRNSPGVQAIFCGSDQIARGVSDTLRLAGRRVPEDIALIGFDNWEPMARGADPAPDQHRHVPGGRRAGRRRAPALGDQPRADPRRAHRAVPAGRPAVDRPRARSPDRPGAADAAGQRGTGPRAAAGQPSARTARAGSGAARRPAVPQVPYLPAPRTAAT